MLFCGFSGNSPFFSIKRTPEEGGGLYQFSVGMSRTVALNLTNVTNELQNVTKWYSLGVQLGIAPRILDEIENDHRTTARRKSALFKYWLENCSNKSWQVLAGAVENIDQKNLARKLKTYVNAPETGTVPTTDGGQSHIRAHVQQTHATTPFTMTQVVTADTRLSDGDVSYLMEILSSVASKWNEIGTALRFNPTELGNIRAQHRLFTGAPNSYLQELLSQWVQWPNDVHPNAVATIGGLESALKSRLVGYGAMAEMLKSKFQQLKSEAEKEGSRLRSLAAQNTDHGGRTHPSSDHGGRTHPSNDHGGRTHRSNDHGYGRRDLHHDTPEIRSRGTARENSAQGSAPPQESVRPPASHEGRNGNARTSLCTTKFTVIGMLLVTLVIVGVVATTKPELVSAFLPKTTTAASGREKPDVKPETHQKDTTKQRLPLEEAPTVPQLTHLKLPVEKYGSGKSINVLQEIGKDCIKFGTLLLVDERGDMVSSIVSQNKGNYEAINRDIVTKWLDGIGKQPDSWETLIEVLEDIKHRTLVQKIRDAIDSS